MMQLVLFLLVVSTSTQASSLAPLREKLSEKLLKVLDFMDEFSDEINFDGALGLTLAQVQIQQAMDIPDLSPTSETFIGNLLYKSESILAKIRQGLPNDPSYMPSFKNLLLEPRNWLRVSLVPQRNLPDLGYYKNWTAQTILRNKKAIYKGVKSDFCLREIIELSHEDQPCYISGVCREMMLNRGRVDSGYLLTHRLLYLQTTKLKNCYFNNSITTRILSKSFCAFMLKEAKTNARLGFPYHDIFLEQMVLCGLEGYVDFSRWLEEVLEWQTDAGCYKSVASEENLTKRTSNRISFGCSDHSTGLAAAALAMNLKYLLL